MKIARYLGLAEESTYNPETPPEATFHVDIASATLDAPTDSQLIYEGGLQRGPKMHRPGFYNPSGNIAYAFDIKTIGFLLKWALGGYDFTAGTPPALNTHEFFGVNDSILPSFTARVGKDLFEHVFSGCTINSLTLEISDGYCMATVDIQGAKDAKDVLVEIEDLLLPEEYPLAFYEVTADLGGDISCEVRNVTITINNNLDAGAGKGIGSRFPCRMVAGDREITVSKDMYFEDTGALEKLWGGATGPEAVDASTEFELTLTFTAPDEKGTMDIIFPRAIYTQVSHQPTGRAELVQSSVLRAFLSTVTLLDASEVETDIYVQIENAETTY